MGKKSYVCNPETGRAIKVGGATWNSILSSNNANLIKKIMNLQKYNTKKKACASLHAGHTHYPHGKYSSPHKHRRSHSKVGDPHSGALHYRSGAEFPRPHLHPGSPKRPLKGTDPHAGHMHYAAGPGGKPHKHRCSHSRGQDLHAGHTHYAAGPGGKPHKHRCSHYGSTASRF